MRNALISVWHSWFSTSDILTSILFFWKQFDRFRQFLFECAPVCFFFQAPNEKKRGPSAKKALETTKKKMGTFVERMLAKYPYSPTLQASEIIAEFTKFYQNQ